VGETREKCRVIWGKEFVNLENTRKKEVLSPMDLINRRMLRKKKNAVGGRGAEGSGVRKQKISSVREARRYTLKDLQENNSKIRRGQRRRVVKVRRPTGVREGGSQ